ncbi:hypothetical protein BKP35_06470 [Anaerobacillus arseniciselenatis]|uniref:Uncharacterized protein n=1 Tax=Anaerobacillus arseniciselenatis TaxID=85682 RepID=A0A1S2LPR5_9BACI|nr:hypothetical protein [Anaerobacillus arseniciselenatis]OIJ14519.1 hypothetical protein BKP35_06470 [Anaerobacillus arseniciselenatis]
MEKQAKGEQLTNTEKVLYLFGGVVFLVAFSSTFFLSSGLSPLHILQLRLTFVGIALVYFLATHFYGQRLQKLIEKILKKCAQVKVKNQLSLSNIKNNTEVKTYGEIVFSNNNQEQFPELVEGYIEDKTSIASVVRIDQKIIKTTVVHFNKKIIEDISTIDGEKRILEALDVHPTALTTKKDVEQELIKHSTREVRNVLDDKTTTEKVIEETPIDRHNHEDVDIPVESRPKKVIHIQSAAALTKQKQSNKKTPKVKTGTERERGKTSTKMVRSKNDQITIWFNGSVHGKK